MFERSSNPLRPCFAGDENFRVFIHDDNDEDDDDEVVTFFQRHSPPPFHRPLAASRVACCLFIFPRRRSPFDAANVSSSKQFFENTFAALKVAPFPPSTRQKMARNAERRPCFSPNGNTVTRLPYVCIPCVCMCVCVGEIHECTLRGTTVAPPGQDGRVDESVYLAFCLASEGRKELLSVL